VIVIEKKIEKLHSVNIYI